MEHTALAISIIALVITCAGWFVCYWLNARTQMKVLVNSLTNEARLTLTDAIRDFHDWYTEIHTLAAAMPVDDITSLGRTDKHHEARRRKLLELSTDRRHLIWLRRLEEYEPLFPGTASARVEILHMLQAACESARTLADQHAPGSPPSKDRLDAFGSTVFDILALSWDLLIYLQNTSIGKITGNKIRERVPADPQCIRLVADKRGILHVLRPPEA